MPLDLSELDPEALTRWMSAPCAHRGVHFSRSAKAWEFCSYARLADLALRSASGLRSYGVGSSDVVALIHGPEPAFVATLFGAFYLGATVSAIAPPTAYQTAERYRAYLAHALRTSAPKLIVVEPRLGDAIRELVDPAIANVMAHSDTLLDAGATQTAAAQVLTADRLALVQLTSGSGGHGRGVRIPVSALTANMHAIRQWLEWTSADPVASWLPVYHDMGLIACLITPVVAGSDLWLMSPGEFIRDPARYLRCFGQQGARLTAMPDFALDYVVRRVAPSMLVDQDFSEWRALVVGAEPIHRNHLERFHQLLKPGGFRRESLLPAYGLAEATLAVTGVALREGWKAKRVPTQLHEPKATVSLSGRDSALAGYETVCCGRPLHGVQVSVVDELGDPVLDCAVGEIIVRGASLGTGYAEPGLEHQSRFSAQGLRTADAGFMADGDLYVIGRFGDCLKMRGRTLFAEDIERAVAELDVAPTRFAATLGTVGSVPTIIVAVEGADSALVNDIRELLLSHTDGASLYVLAVPTRAIPRTSSGKAKRSQLWHELVPSRVGASSAPSGSRR